MVRKCCVTGCKSNYLTEDEKVSTYRLPSNPEERKRWIKAIPRDNIPDSPHTVVCAKHFPSGFPDIKVRGNSRPRDPPSVFENIPKSLIPTPAPSKRPTTKATSSARSQKDDELSTFLLHDTISSFDTFCTNLLQHKFELEVTSFLLGEYAMIPVKRTLYK